MAYATAADVQAHVPTQLCTIGATSQPSQTTVDAWIAAQSGWLDATLRWKYAVPVTDATDLATLKTLCSLLVAAQVWDVLGGHATEQPGNGAALRKAALVMLAYDPKTGQSHLVLPGTTLSDSGEATVLQAEGSFTDPDAESSVDRTFKMGEDSW